MKKETIFVSIYIVVVLAVSVMLSLTGCEESSSSEEGTYFFTEEGQKAYEDSFEEMEICQGQGIFIPVDFDQEFEVTDPTMNDDRILDIKVLVQGHNEGLRYFTLKEENSTTITRLKIRVKNEDCEISDGVIIINPGTSFQEVLHEQNYLQYLDISAQIEDSGLDDGAVFIKNEEFITTPIQEQ